MDKILLVSSNEYNNNLIDKYLSKSGFAVYSASSGSSALAKIKIIDPSLIIIDTVLSDMSGYDLCKRIKNNKVFELILIAIMWDADSSEDPVKAMSAGADDILYKNLDPKVFISRVKSILRIRYLSNQLMKQYAELQEKNRILDFEMKMAMQVQRSLIQETDCYINEIHFVSKYMPAMEIGGDFYDIIRLDNHRVAVVMGDVSGHGISAALLTSMLTHMIKTLVQFYPSPNALLSTMNKEFCNIFKNTMTDIYACVVYALIDTRNRTITYSNAGHALPYFVLAKENNAVELTSSGVPIGLMENSEYTNAVLDCYPGDILFLQTDGLCDIFYKDRPDIYSKKLREILLENKDLPPEHVLDIILSTFYKWEMTDNEKLSIDDVSIIMCIC